jgi:hypothetical protein
MATTRIGFITMGLTPVEDWRLYKVNNSLIYMIKEIRQVGVFMAGSLFVLHRFLK